MRAFVCVCESVCVSVCVCVLMLMIRPWLCLEPAAPPPKLFSMQQQVTRHNCYLFLPSLHMTVFNAAAIAEAGVKERADVGVAVDFAADRLCVSVGARLVKAVLCNARQVRR